MNAAIAHPRPLGPDAQRPRRRLERRARRRALALRHWAAARGVSAADVADCIGVSRQTLDHWVFLRNADALDAPPRGRPALPLQADVGDDIQEILEDRRGRLGLPSLKDLFPDVPRTTLKDLRDQYMEEHAPTMEYLTWTRPGTVWSADFTETPGPVDGQYPYILAVRDLASSRQLLAWPTASPASRFVVQALTFLFQNDGHPIVFKSDNGGSFTAGDVASLLADFHVTHLLSPPVTPRYNGAQEAAIGSLKTRALHIAGTCGRAACWTCDDVEAARIEANQQSRPHGPNGPSPEELWRQRTPIGFDQRSFFHRALVRATADERRKLIDSKAQTPGFAPALVLNALDRAAVARRATRRVLIDLGYLLARRTVNLSTHQTPVFAKD